MPFIDILGDTLEYERIPGARNRPPVVLLHEGLGSVAAWRDFPQRLAADTAHGVLTYSRMGYGKSDPLPQVRGGRTPDFMHHEAFDVLPELLAALKVEHPVLFGHSDGASIALLYASRHRVAGVIAMAPHVIVEDISIAGIETAKLAFETTDLRARLARYHDDVDGAFRGWNDGWLNPAFRDWNIENTINDIRDPILAIQGEDDAYGTLYQIEEIQRRAGQTRLLAIPDCGHSPQREQPGQVLAAVRSFLATLPQVHTGDMPL